MRINSKVNVEVRNENDDLVAAIVDETPQDIEGSSIISSINEDGEKIVILPADATYDVSITGREDDTVNYGISEYCASAGEYTRVVNYFDIPLAEGQSLSAEIPAYSAEELDDSAQLEEGSDTVYTLVSANNIVLPSSSDMSGEEATDAYYSVTATSSNTAYGMAYGSGTRQYGSFAQLEAIPSENCEFLGWYAGKTLVSSDAQYRVRVTEDMELEARFAVQQGCYEVTFDANGGMPENTVRISDETGKLSSLPMVMRENYLFDGWFTDATDGAEISADTVFTRSMTVYAHWSDGDAATSGTCGEALTWTLDEAGTLTISGTGDMTDWSDAAGTPWYAFHDSIETVVIENGVTSIGEYAFNDYVVRIEVYYNGTEAQWSEVRIGANNESLREANFHFQENNTATPQLVVESKTAKAGETVVVNVSIRNNPGIMTFNLGFDHDSGLTLQSVQKAEGLEGFFNYDQTAVYLQNADITEDCDLLTLTFEVAPDAEGDQRVTISSVDASNQNEETVTFEVIDGSVTVKNHIPGDINGDKAVNLLDLVRFIKRLSGELVTVVTDALDVNGDGKVTIQDLVRLLKYLSGEDVEIF